MKKFTTLLIILTLVTVGIFAVDNASFDITTTVAGINAMKITAAEFSGTTAAALSSATGVTTPYNVSASGAQSGFNGWLSTISNNRKGYKVTMSATAMTSAVTGQSTSYINYTVAAGGKSITTNGATAVPAVTVVDKTSLTALTANSAKITLSVDSTTFNAAVEGSYTGTVTFTYTAN